MKITAVIAVFLALTSSLLGYQLSMERAHLKESRILLAKLEAEISNLKSARTAYQSAFERERAAARSNSSAIALTNPESRGCASVMPSSLTNGVHEEGPALRALLIENWKTDLAQRYAALLSSLSLSEEQENTLLELLAARYLPEARGAREKQEIDDQISTALGPQNWQRFLDYEQSLPIQAEVHQLNSDLLARGIPLNDSQREALMGSIAYWHNNLPPPAPPSDRKPTIDDLENLFKWEDEVDRLVLQQVKGTLTLAQARYVRDAFQREASNRKAQLEWNREQLAADKNARLAFPPDVVINLR